MEDISPYSGVMPYTEKNAEFFFGRKREIGIVTANLFTSRLAVVYGSTGVGKSSLLTAGVASKMNEFTRNKISKGEQPNTVVIVFKSWNKDYLIKLKNRIIDSVSKTLNIQYKIQTFDPSSQTLMEIIRDCIQSSGIRLFIILDQFEQYLLLHSFNLNNQPFVIELSEVINKEDIRVHFLISLREEWFTYLDRFETVIPNLFLNSLRINHLDYESAYEAIEKPIEKYNEKNVKNNITIESKLIKNILMDLGNLHDELGSEGITNISKCSMQSIIFAPYLQMVMIRIWEEEKKKNSSILRLQTFKDLGGAKEIVKTHLDKIMDDLEIRECEISAKIFHHLVTPSGLKIPYTLTDLASYTKVNETELKILIEKFCVRGVLREIPPTYNQSEVMYEIYHDILVLSIYDWHKRFNEFQIWLKDRPWGYIQMLQSGTCKFIHDSQISIGRWMPHDLREFELPWISRLHMSIIYVTNDSNSETHIFVYDMRSKNGTTLNGKYLLYGNIDEINNGDIIAIAGVSVFKIYKIDYPTNKKFEIVNPVIQDHPNPFGWGLLIDGNNKKVYYLDSDECFLSLDLNDNLKITENIISTAFFQIKRNNQFIKYKFLNKQNKLIVSIKIGAVESTIRKEVNPYFENELGGTMTFQYQNTIFQIIPFQNLEKSRKTITSLYDESVFLDDRYSYFDKIKYYLKNIFRR